MKINKLSNVLGLKGKLIEPIEFDKEINIVYADNAKGKTSLSKMFEVINGSESLDNLQLNVDPNDLEFSGSLHNSLNFNNLDSSKTKNMFFISTNKTNLFKEIINGRFIKSPLNMTNINSLMEEKRKIFDANNINLLFINEQIKNAFAEHLKISIDEVNSIFNSNHLSNEIINKIKVTAVEKENKKFINEDDLIIIKKVMENKKYDSVKNSFQKENTELINKENESEIKTLIADIKSLKDVKEGGWQKLLGKIDMNKKGTEEKVTNPNEIMKIIDLIYSENNMDEEKIKLFNAATGNKEILEIVRTANLNDDSLQAYLFITSDESIYSDIAILYVNKINALLNVDKTAERLISLNDLISKEIQTSNLLINEYIIFVKKSMQSFNFNHEIKINESPAVYNLFSDKNFNVKNIELSFLLDKNIVLDENVKYLNGKKLTNLELLLSEGEKNFLSFLDNEWEIEKFLKGKKVSYIIIDDPIDSYSAKNSVKFVLDFSRLFQKWKNTTSGNVRIIILTHSKELIKAFAYNLKPSLINFFNIFYSNQVITFKKYTSEDIKKYIFSEGLLSDIEKVIINLIKLRADAYRTGDLEFVGNLSVFFHWYEKSVLENCIKNFNDENKAKINQIFLDNNIEMLNFFDEVLDFDQIKFKNNEQNSLNVIDTQTKVTCLMFYIRIKLEYEIRTLLNKNNLEDFNRIIDSNMIEEILNIKLNTNTDMLELLEDYISFVLYLFSISNPYLHKEDQEVHSLLEYYYSDIEELCLELNNKSLNIKNILINN